VLNKNGIDLKRALEGGDEEIRRKLLRTYTLLAKNKEDRDKLWQVESR
jgi:hypothetical protein